MSRFHLNWGTGNVNLCSRPDCPQTGPCSEQCTDARAHCQSPEHYDDFDQARFTYEGAMARYTLPVPVKKRARSAR